MDFIFGRHGFAYFGGNTIASKGPGCITASGRETDADGSCAYMLGAYSENRLLTTAPDVFNQNTIILAPDAVPNTAGNIFLGRPWGGTYIFPMHAGEILAGLLISHHLIA